MKTNFPLKSLCFLVAYTAVTVVAAVGLPSIAAAGTPLVSKASGLCLDIVGVNQAAGAAIDVWSCNGGTNQQWEFTTAGELRSLDGSRCLDAYGGGITNGTKVTSYTCTGGVNQQWTFASSGQIVSQSGLCLDVSGGATTKGTAVVLWGCHGGINQIWSKAVTSSASGCVAETWTRGVNYPLGTVVKYTNGNYYKEVNAGTNGSDGNDPVISTWYWQPTTCTSTAVGSAGNISNGDNTSGPFVLTEAQFNSMFPSRNALYTYGSLVKALSAYPAFAHTGNDTTKKREVAAFLANVAHDSDSLKIVRQANRTNASTYCSGDCAPGQQYYGRGPIQLSWNYFYRAAGEAIGVDLLAHPDLVATDSTIAWKTAIWYWMTNTAYAGVTPHNAIVNDQDFAATIRAINGSEECRGAAPDEVQTRVNFYSQFVGIVGIPLGDKLYC